MAALSGRRMHQPIPLAAGYVGSLYPALADGRMILRTPDRLVCFDFRVER